MRLRIGTAGWGIPSALAQRFPGAGSHLERYARAMPCVEIDTSFYRPHRRQTYERWAVSTPSAFRFAVKLPRAITHEARLASSESLLEAFLAEAGGLGAKLHVLLIQLPPSLAFEPAVVEAFLAATRRRFPGRLVCEPRERSWFTPEADALLARWQVSRVAADPAPLPEAAAPGGWLGRGALRYFRWHGSPRTYWSRYEAGWLRARLEEMARLPRGAECWCILDNTASGAALANALELAEMARDAAPAGSRNAAPEPPDHASRSAMSANASPPQGPAFDRLPTRDEPSGATLAVIEACRGSSNKMKFNVERRVFELHAVLPVGQSFPYDFGFLPSTLGEDGDPLDVLVLMDEPVPVGCVVPCEVIGVIRADQRPLEGARRKAVRNDRFLAVATKTERYRDLKELSALPDRLLDEIESFFAAYMARKGVRFRPLGREGRRGALALIEEGRKLFSRRG